MRSRVVVAVVAVFLLAPATAAVASGDERAPPPRPMGVPEEKTTITIDVQPDGDAVWEIEHTFELEDESEVRAFTRYSRGTEGTLEDTQRLRRDMRAVAAKAEQHTGRDMEVTHFTSSSRRTEGPLDRDIAVVTFTFTWHNFARDTDYGVSVGDAFEGEFELDDNQRLVIEGPEEMEARAASPSGETNGNVVWWDGKREFYGDEPNVQFFAGVDGEGFDAGIDLDSDLSVIVGAVGLASVVITCGYVVIVRRLTDG